MRPPHLQQKTWVLLGVCAAVAAYALIDKPRGVILPTEWEACSSAGLQAMTAGRFDEAERYFLRALDQASQSADDGPRLGTSLDNLASLRKAQRRLADAEQLYRKSLVAFERAGPKWDRQLAIVCNDLGTVRAAQGDLNEAEALIARAIAINERVRGPNDPEVAINLRNYAAVKLALGKPGDAAAAAMRAAAIDERQPRQGRP
jgi:tetratricopeptide (TPR) repeat protein